MFQNWKLLRSPLQSWHRTKIDEFIGGLIQESHQINFSSCFIFSGHPLSNSSHIENILIFTKCVNKSFECCYIEQAGTLEIDSGKQRIMQNFSTQAIPENARFHLAESISCLKGTLLALFLLGVYQDPKILFWKRWNTQSVNLRNQRWFNMIFAALFSSGYSQHCKLTQSLRLTSTGFPSILHDICINSIDYCLQIM